MAHEKEFADWLAHQQECAETSAALKFAKYGYAKPLETNRTAMVASVENPLPKYVNCLSTVAPIPHPDSGKGLEISCQNCARPIRKNLIIRAECLWLCPACADMFNQHCYVCNRAVKHSALIPDPTLPIGYCAECAAVGIAVCQDCGTRTLKSQSGIRLGRWFCNTCIGANSALLNAPEW